MMQYMVYPTECSMCASEECVFCYSCGSFLQMSIRSSCFIVLFKSFIFQLIFLLVVPSTVEFGVLNSPATVVELSSFPPILLVFVSFQDSVDKSILFKCLSLPDVQHFYYKMFFSFSSNNFFLIDFFVWFQYNYSNSLCLLLLR